MKNWPLLNFLWSNNSQYWSLKIGVSSEGYLLIHCNWKWMSYNEMNEMRWNEILQNRHCLIGSYTKSDDDIDRTNNFLWPSFDKQTSKQINNHLTAHQYYRIPHPDEDGSISNVLQVWSTLSAVRCGQAFKSQLHLFFIGNSIFIWSWSC